MQNGGIARRTRSQWDAFYRNHHAQINNKPPPPATTHPNTSNTSRIDPRNDDDAVGKKHRHKGGRKPGRPKKISNDDDHLITTPINISAAADLLLDPSIVTKKDQLQSMPKIHDQPNLPLKFNFEDSTEKTDSDDEIHSLFRDLEMGLWESQIQNPTISQTRVDDESTGDTQASRCDRGDHETFLDEQIGVVCKYCFAVLLEIKHVLPPFCTHTPDSDESKYYKDTHDEDIRNQLQFKDKDKDNLESSHVDHELTVLDFITDTAKELYPHQLDGFKFLWRNIAGDIRLDKLQTLPADGGRGCIISHAPGTGKTRLTIVFLQTFMKLYPSSRPMIVAPVGMLLTWEQEFKKWNLDVTFHNLNKTKMSGHDHNNSSSDYSGRLVKLRSWVSGGSILGISYGLFEQLAGEHENNNDNLKRILLEMPDLLVLDEGHTARSETSLIWNTLTKIKTPKRVMLSGTPFQNNFEELYNTLCLVNPGFINEIMPASIQCKKRKRKLINAGRVEWATMTSSIAKKRMISDLDLEKIRSMMEAFVHIYKGGILEKNLPGMRDWLIILKPTDLQNELLDYISAKSDRFLERDHIASLISVHPTLVSERPEFLGKSLNLRALESNPDAGVKTCFLMNLIQASSRLKEKVLVFSQFIPPLRLMVSLLEQHLAWKEGREIIYMDGTKKMNERHGLMRVFNEKSSEAKVLLASQKACSEGINLVGASRVVMLDVVWNPSVERQAICRAYRLGQEKMVHVYRLLTPVEVNKYRRQAEKERLSELIFSRGEEGKRRGDGEDGDDKVLEAMVGHQTLGSIFERIVASPKDSEVFC